MFLGEEINVISFWLNTLQVDVTTNQKLDNMLFDIKIIGIPFQKYVHKLWKLNVPILKIQIKNEILILILFYLFVRFFICFVFLVYLLLL